MRETNIDNTLLSIKDLYVEYRTYDGTVKAINGLDLTVQKGEAVGLVGETGAGKTTTALSILGVLPPRAAKVTQGSIKFDGLELLDPQNKNKLEKIRGKRISMIFQNPLTSLNPVFTVGEQIAMVLMKHEGLSKKKAYERVEKSLESVNIEPRRAMEYPHQFSGGMRQRVGIAAALVTGDPDLLIADEPTTALDVTIQAQILELIKKLQREKNLSMIMITHNLGIVAEICTKVSIIYSGRIIESGSTKEVFKNPRHPYTIGLIGSLPDIAVKKNRLTPIPGFMADPLNLPKGCSFNIRCPYAQDVCREKIPAQIQLGADHFVCCHFATAHGGFIAQH